MNTTARPNRLLRDGALGAVALAIAVAGFLGQRITWFLAGG